MLLLWAFFAITQRVANPKQFYLSLEMSSSASSTAQLFYDIGRNFNEQDSITLPVVATGSSNFQKLIFPLPFASVSGLRFDPIAVEGTFTLRNISIIEPYGQPVRITPFDVIPLNQIQQKLVDNNEVRISTVLKANDPSLQLSLHHPVDCRLPSDEYSLLLILDGLLFLFLSYLLWGDLLTRSGRFWNPELLYAVLVLLGLLHICFWPAIWGDRTLLESSQDAPSILPNGASGAKVHTPFYKVLDPGAPAWEPEPLLAVVSHIYESESVAPLWNPYQGFGTPLAANMQSQPFTPLIAPLVFRLTPRTYSIFLLTRLLIAGLGCFLYLRLFVSFTAALCGAVVATLGGYYMLYIAMPHLSVEVWLPSGVFAAECLLRKPSYYAVLGLTGVIFLILVGGMPESSTLLLLFIYAYSLFRIVTDKELRSDWKRRLAALGIAAASGVGLALFLLLPFVEFVRHSFNSHQQQHTGAVTGLLYDPIGPAIFSYVFPFLFGPPITSSGVFSGLRNYCGLVPLVVISIAVSRLFVWKFRNHRLTPITFFFSLAVVVLLLKRFGFTEINDLGSLPILKLIIFGKYDEALMTVSLAVLCGIGMEHVLHRSISQSGIRRSLVFAFLFILLALNSSKEIVQSLLASPVNINFVAIGLGIPIFFFVLAVFAVLHYNDIETTGQRKRLTAAFILLIGGELCFNFVVPQYRWLGEMPYVSEDPYNGAPFVRFLKKRITNGDRIFGRDLVLHPNWSSAFQLSDIRNLDALYYRKYFPFVLDFLTPPPIPDELQNRFTGGADYKFGTPREQRLLQLSSVRYLATEQPFTFPDRAHPFKLIYNKESLLYEFDDVLPRAALYFHAERLKGDAAILKRLAEPSLDIFSDVVLNDTRFTPVESAFVDQLNKKNDPPRVQAACIRKYQSRNVEIEAESDRGSILVLNDSDYPGWSVDVDGKEGKILSANYLFRGVLLQPGKHLIRFTYSPRTFRIGRILSIATLVLLLAGWLITKMRNGMQQKEKYPDPCAGEAVRP